MKTNHLFKKGAKKGAIIMLHGNSSSFKVFENVFNSNIDHSLMAIDLIGHGDSEHTGSYSLSDYKKQVLDVINDIDDDILLVGNSLGGHLVIEIANQVSNLKGLLIFGTPPVKRPLNMEEAFLPTTTLNTFFTEHPSAEDINSSLSVAAHNKSVIPLLKEDFLKADPKVRTDLASDIENWSDEFILLKNLSCLKFVIHGSEDPAVSLKYLEVIQPDCNYELITMNECGHYPSIEKPDEFINHLEKIAATTFL